jgi:cell division cycle protein 20 (cofactor of APC complex)
MIKMNEHKAAVKALSWCPWNTGVLATGGGKQDGTIKLWNVFSGVLKNSIETNSQVSGLIWSKFNRELLSSHGEPDHQLSVWKFPSLNKIGDIHGHAERVLSIALSPNGEQVVSLGADETLRNNYIFLMF